MTHAEQFLLSHPLTVLAGFILGEQTGLPIASAPMLLLIGTLIARGQVSGPLSIIVAVAACVNGICKRGEDINIHLRGGLLKIRWEIDTVWMTGPAELVFTGEIELA